MAYMLRNGKRYYQDERGNVSLDNVSQEEADRRERRNSMSSFVHSDSAAGTVYRQASVHWGAIIILGIVFMVIGAIIYSQSHVSTAEKAIADYMNNVAGVDVNSQTDDRAEQMIENVDKGMEESGVVVSSEGQSDYILPESAERYLDASEIKYCSHKEIQLMINEIYARHGREFHSQDNIDYFAGMDWYDPVSGKTDEEIVREFNEYERANVDLLSKYL